MTTQAELDAIYEASRERWQRMEGVTVRRIKADYRRATDALADRIARTPGPVTRSYLGDLHADLVTVTDTLNAENMASLHRGITWAFQQTSQDTLTLTSAIAPLAGSARVRGAVQGVAEAEAAAWLTRVGTDGMTLSDRVWEAGRDYQRAVERITSTAIITGQSARETARQLEAYVRRPMSPQSAEVARQLGIPQHVDYRAVRLARTEINAAAREATVLTNRANPFYRGVWWRRSNIPYPCDRCDELAHGGPNGDGFYPTGQEPTPAASHPNCRCVIIPDYDDQDDVTRRLGDWIENPSSQPAVDHWFQGMRTGGPITPPPAVPAAPPAPPPPTVPKFRPATTAKEANAYSQSLGIQQSNWIKRDLAIANRVNQDLAELAEKGYDLPDKIYVQSLRGSDANTIAYYSSRRGLPNAPDTLGINRASDHWLDPAARQASMFKSNWQSTPDVQHVIRHEMGHKAHHDNDQAQYDSMGRGVAGWRRHTTDVRALQLRLAKDVSEYGASGPPEFVAEVFAGRLGGRTFPQEIMDFYRFLGGPPV